MLWRRSRTDPSFSGVFRSGPVFPGAFLFIFFRFFLFLVSTWLFTDAHNLDVVEILAILFFTNNGWPFMLYP